MITLTLTAYNMGEATELDFEGWADYVAEHIDERCGFPVTVEAFSFSNGPARDQIAGATDEQRETIREALDAMWENAEWEPRTDRGSK